MNLQNDLSILTRDELRDLLSSAKDEWEEYTYYRDEIECRENRIEEESIEIEAANSERKLAFIFSVISCITVIIPVILLFYASMQAKRKKEAQRRIEEDEAQLPELRIKKEEAIRALDKVWNIPDEYCYDYALTKMLQYINSFKAHNWKEVTNLYDKHVHEQTVENNTRITAEEAMNQTDISRQTRDEIMNQTDILRQTRDEVKNQTDILRKTRNAARWAAVGSWLR